MLRGGSRNYELAILLVLCLYVALLSRTTIAAKHRQFVLLISEDSAESHSSDQEGLADDDDNSNNIEYHGEEVEPWDESGSTVDPSPIEDLDPGSWKPISGNSTHKQSLDDGSLSRRDLLYHSGIRRMLSAATDADPNAMAAAVQEFQAAAELGHVHAQSALGFLYANGIGVEQNDAKSFLYHSFSSHGGNYQSKLALASGYFRQQMVEEAVKLYEELAGMAVASFSRSIDTPLIELVPLNDGMEENKEVLRKSRGEENDDFQVLEYQARKGNSGAMFKVGLFYYWGLRGVQHNHQKALAWFLKAVEKGETIAMEFVGEIYARGHGVERNYTKALEWFTTAVRHKRFSAYNGIGYLYVKGQGVERQNYTLAKYCFNKAATHNVPDGHYNLGVLYLQGKGVERDVVVAIKHFMKAAGANHPKALFQLAKLFHKGVGMKKNLATATLLYKMVTERGPWASIMRWAFESYMKGDMGKALLLYSRAAELGYEMAQSNAAWLLEKAGEGEACIGVSGFCTRAERYRRAHLLWWHASEQGNDDAALIIGDAYYYGRGMERDLERAVRAYQHARSQANAQAIFNLGYMHEHGLGLPRDLHLAKRYYDEALQKDANAALPVYLALIGLWLRQHYKDSFLVRLMDSLPESFPKMESWLRSNILDEGNVTLVTLLVCLLTVLYLRKRRLAAQAVRSPRLQ